VGLKEVVGRGRCGLLGDLLGSFSVVVVLLLRDVERIASLWVV
jgi:hypothetical protein